MLTGFQNKELFHRFMGLEYESFHYKAWCRRLLVGNVP